MQTVKVTAVGDSMTLVIPPTIVDRLGIADGAELQLSETENGIELTPCKPSFEEQMELAEQIMEKRKELLRRLAE